MTGDPRAPNPTKSRFVDALALSFPQAPKLISCPCNSILHKLRTPRAGIGVANSRFRHRVPTSPTDPCHPNSSVASPHVRMSATSAFAAYRTPTSSSFNSRPCPPLLLPGSPNTAPSSSSVQNYNGCSANHPMSPLAPSFSPTASFPSPALTLYLYAEHPRPQRHPKNPHENILTPSKHLFRFFAHGLPYVASMNTSFISNDCVQHERDTQT